MKQWMLTILFLFITYSITCAQNKGEGVTDIDGNTYSTVIIGNQEWMAENLRSSHYANGDVIPNVTDNNEWSEISTGAWSHFDNRSQNGVVYGKLYNWYAVNDERSLCPDNWRIPTKEEWDSMIEFHGRAGINGGRMKTFDDNLWLAPNTGATNEHGFSAIPGGKRDFDGQFKYLKVFGYWWTSSDVIPGYSWYIRLDYDNSGVFSHYYQNQTGFSVRCVKQ